MRTLGWLGSLVLVLGIAGCYGTHDTVPDAPDPEVPEVPRDAPCAEGEWCWVEGAPVVALDGVAVPGAAVPAVYAVDDGGALWRWTGAGWTAVGGPGGRRATSVYVASADDVWVVTESLDGAEDIVRQRLERFDGARWTEVVDVGSRWLSGIGDHVWAQRPGGGYLHFDGASWHELPAPEGLMFSVLPGPSGELYAIVLESTDPSSPPSVSVMRHDGAEWSSFGPAFDEPDAYNRSLVWSDGELRVLSRGDALRLDGDVWTTVATPTVPEGYVLSGSGPRGLAAIPAELHCHAVPVGADVFCAWSVASGWARPSVVHGRSDGTWEEHRLTPERSAPLARERWDAVAPSLWAAQSARSWANGPDDVLRFRPLAPDEPGAAAPPRALERWDGRAWSAVIGPDGAAITTPWNLDLDGVAGEDPWAVAGATLYRVRGLDASPIPMPAELAAISLRAVAAAPGDRAYAIAYAVSRTRGVRWLILGVDGDAVTVVEERPAGDREDALELSDLATGPDGELWVLGVIGHYGRTAGRGFLQRWAPGSSARDPRIDLWDGVWGFRQLERYGDDFYVSGSSVYRLPIADAIPGAVIDVEAHDLGGSAITLSPFDAELWVGPSGVWLTSATQQARVLAGAP